jgi:hypothetical protein
MLTAHTPTARSADSARRSSSWPPAPLEQPSCLPGLKSASGPPQVRDPEAVWRDIKSLAETEAASASSSFIHPKLTLRIIGTPQLRIVKGDVSDLGFGDDPYGMPFRKQILIESLRRALAEANLEGTAKQTGPERNAAAPGPGTSQTPEKKPTASDGSQKWQCYLDQAEQLVRQAVVAIETVTDKDQLKRLLQKTEDQIDELLYSKLFESIEQYAKDNRYNVIYERGGETVKPFSVSVTSVPDGAKVWVITELVYRKQLIMRVDRAQWPWKELVQSPADLIGKYRYMAVWPDGKRAEGSIEVTNANPLKFQPR